MPTLPPVIWLGLGIQILPSIAYAAAARRSHAALAVALGSAVSLAADLVSLVMTERVSNNHLVTYLSSPIFAVLLLAGLREWQVTPRARQVFTITILTFLVSTVLLIAFVEDVSTFNLGIGPLYSLMLLAGGLWTLARRASEVEIAPLYKCDWFWVALGLAMYGASTALASPVGGFFLSRQRSDLVVVAWEIRAVLVTLAFLLMSWGIYRGPMVSKFSTIGTIAP